MSEVKRMTVATINGNIQAVAATDYDSLKAERDRLQKELSDLHSARSAPAERVEVVGYAGLNQLELHRLLPKYPGMKVKKEPNERYTEPLMTVAQYQRITAAMAAELEVARTDLAYFPPTVRALTEKIAELRAELEAARKQEPVAIANKGDCAFWVSWTEAGKPLRGPGIKLYALPPLAGKVDVPDGWREFIEDCATTAGNMVNGNRLSARAKELLAGQKQDQQREGEQQ